MCMHYPSISRDRLTQQDSYSLLLYLFSSSSQLISSLYSLICAAAIVSDSEEAPIPIVCIFCAPISDTLTFMRLLHFNEADTFVLTNFHQKIIPPYAILSHRLEGCEILFADLENGAYKKKGSFRKLRFCANRAAHDGLRYFWIDTCCMTNGTYTSCQDRSIQCTVGMRMLQGVMCSCQTSPLLPPGEHHNKSVGKLRFGRASGSQEAGHSKSSSRP
jgi:hypothetical protein